MPDEIKKPKMRVLKPEEQLHGTMYEMGLRFKADAGLRSLDGVLEACFPGEPKPVLKDGLVLRMTQTVPFIPDDGMLKEYARIIGQNYGKDGDARISGVRFDGYDFLYAVGPASVKKCAHEDDAGACSIGASSSGACKRPCSHYERDTTEGGQE